MNSKNEGKISDFDIEQFKFFVKQNLNPGHLEFYLQCLNISKIFTNQKCDQGKKMKYLVPFIYILNHFIGIIYIFYKLFQYLPYRNLKDIDFYSSPLIWIAPSYRLEEFSDESNSTNGSIWGSIKLINESVKNSCYAFIPYLDKNFKNHYSQSKAITKLNKTTRFKLYPLAAGLDLKTALNVLQVYHKCATSNFRIIQMLNKEKNNFNIKNAVINCLNGRNLAEVLLNQKLIDNFNEKITYDSIIFANCEGQPWEISLRYSNYAHNNILLNLVFSLPDIENSCDLRNHLIFPIRDNIKILTGFSENIGLLKLITKKISLVDPQRFITLSTKFQFKRKINRVVYFCDLNENRTLEFLKVIDDFLKTEKRFVFAVKYHPTSKIRAKDLNSTITVSGDDIKDFDPDCFIFGAQTSSMLQSEYSLVRKFIFQGNRQNFSTNPVIRQIKAISSVSDLKNYLYDSNEYHPIKMEYDLNLSMWKKIIDESLSDGKSRC